ncbi:MAG TPA: LysE family transporter [Alphaproteobacteria bacterium]
MLFWLFLKGLAVGFVIAAPVGPINIMCVRRTIVHGRFAGIISGFGAAVADTLLGAIAVFGLAFVTAFLQAERLWLTIGGIVLLVVLGIRALVRPPPKLVSGRDPSSLIGDFTSTLFLTLSNPVTIISFVGVFAAFGLDADDQVGFSDWVVLLGVFSGSMGWWLILTGLVGLFHGRFTETGLMWANRITGVLLLAAAAVVSVEALRIWQI